MGTTAQKLQRVLDTKEGLKDTINTYLGQDITSAIPFKDYETYIKNFYGSLPKTDYAEGSNITLSNTLKGKLDFEDGIVGYGDTEQNGTPTPDSPQDIEVVRGTQTVYIKDENNNIIDTKTINLGEYEFAKIGNYVDTIEYDVDEDKVYKNENVNKKVFDETTFFQYDLTNAVFYYGVTNRAVGTETTQNIYCDKLFWNGNFSGVGNTGSMQKYQIACNNNGTSKNIFIKNTDYNATNTFNEWLRSINASFYYPLAETVKQEITTTLKDQIKALYYSHSFTGTTIIEIDGQLPLIIKVRALKGE